jgi:hypothetical protein
MTRLILLPSAKRGRGNPNWGKGSLPIPVLLTEFETEVERLALTSTVRRFIAAKALV